MQKSTATIAALIVVALGTATFATASYAEERTGPQFGREHFGKEVGERASRHESSKGGLLDFTCSDRGAEQLAISFVRLEYRVDLNADQQALFGTLKDAAMTAQANLAETCKTTFDAAAATDAMPDLVDRIENRIAIQTAELEAWSSVLPSLEGFIGSLTDEQKQALQPPMRHHAQFDDRGPGGPGAPGGPNDTMGPDGNTVPGDPTIEDQPPA